MKYDLEGAHGAADHLAWLNSNSSAVGGRLTDVRWQLAPQQFKDRQLGFNAQECARDSRPRPGLTVDTRRWGFDLGTTNISGFTQQILKPPESGQPLHPEFAVQLSVSGDHLLFVGLSARLKLLGQPGHLFGMRGRCVPSCIAGNEDGRTGVPDREQGGHDREHG